MEQALENLPERDSSSSISTPSIMQSSADPTPVMPVQPSDRADLVYSSHSAGSNETDRWVSTRDSTAPTAVPAATTMSPPSEAATTTDCGYYSRSEPRSYTTGSRHQQQPPGGNLQYRHAGSSSSSSVTTTPRGLTSAINTSDDEFFITSGKPPDGHFYKLTGSWQPTDLPENTSAKSDENVARIKRTSFGSVTEYGNTSVSNYKVPSEPALNNPTQYVPHPPRRRNNPLACKSVESFSLIGSRARGGGTGDRYHYTSLRTALSETHAGSATLKSRSEADLADATAPTDQLAALVPAERDPERKSERSKPAPPVFGAGLSRQKTTLDHGFRPVRASPNKPPDDVTVDVMRPVAMVTRTTQVPSPATAKRRQSHK